MSDEAINARRVPPLRAPSRVKPSVSTSLTSPRPAPTGMRGGDGTRRSHPSARTPGTGESFGDPRWLSGVGPRAGPHGDAGVAGTATAGLPAAQLVSRSLVANCAGVKIGRSSLRTSRSLSPVTRYARRSIASARR